MRGSGAKTSRAVGAAMHARTAPTGEREIPPPACPARKRPRKLACNFPAGAYRRTHPAMHRLALSLAFLVSLATAAAQTVTRNVPYSDAGHERHVLDIHAPAGARGLPVVFWIHGGGWVTGDKSSVQQKPAAFTARGFIFVATNYRLLPVVDMATLVRDVAKSLGWVHANIARHGGDPARIFVMGHSAGAQLAALLCTDDRYLKAEGVPFSALKGCVPVDGDTYDIPAMISTTEHRRKLHGQPLPKSGHREKFGNDPALHREFSAITHVAAGKSIPPFLILHVAEQPDNTAQAFTFANALKAARVPVKLFAGKETSHNRINDQLGVPDDLATQELFAFVTGALR